MPVKSYRDDLLTRLANPEYAAQYLKVALDETLEDGNQEAFLLALKNVVEAKGAVQQVANDARVSRQHLHRLFSGQGNPTLETLASLLKAVGLTIDFKPMAMTLPNQQV
jgi:probable addiction module antidote protein